MSAFNPRTHIKLTSLWVARYQGTTDLLDRLSRQGYSKILQGALEPLFKRSKQPSGRTKGAARSEEVGIAARKG